MFKIVFCSASGTPERRGPGIPRKVNLEELKDQKIDLEENMGSVEKPLEVSAEPKRGRGRPPKVKVKQVEVKVVSVKEIPTLLSLSEQMSLPEAIELEKQTQNPREKYSENVGNFDQLKNSGDLTNKQKESLSHSLEETKKKLEECELKLNQFSPEEQKAVSSFIEEKKIIECSIQDRHTDVDFVTMDLRKRENTLLQARLKMKSAITEKKLLEEAQKDVIKASQSETASNAVLKKR
jgi:hypothetical protein